MKLSTNMLDAFLRLARGRHGSRIAMPTLDALDSRGLIEVSLYREVSLTPRGRELYEAHAAYVARRDELLAAARVVSGLSDAEAQDTFAPRAQLNVEGRILRELERLEGPFYGSATDPAVVAVLGPPTVARS